MQTLEVEPPMGEEYGRAEDAADKHLPAANSVSKELTRVYQP